MAAFLERSWEGSARGLALTFAMLAGILLSGGIPANAASDPQLRHALHMAHLAHLAHIRSLRQRPWVVEIPAIGVAADLMTLGDTDGAMLSVPPLAQAATEAGWYQFTSVPGSAGNSVIVGHVDTYVGPAVFYNLYQLRPGDDVYVDSGTSKERFAVRWVREVAKVRFPVQRVFGSTGKHQLWLITCGGAFDYQTGHYLDNIIVLAVWQPTVKHRAKRSTTRHKAHPKAQHKTQHGKHRAPHPAKTSGDQQQIASRLQ